MHALHRHPQHEYVDLDLTCPLEDGPESLRLCSVVGAGLIAVRGICWAQTDAATTSRTRYVLTSPV